MFPKKLDKFLKMDRKKKLKLKSLDLMFLWGLK